MTFRTTRWTLVRAASGAATPERRAALETLCTSYGPPVYAFVRRHGAEPERAEDLTQAFFARLLETDGLAGAERERGRFRSYLLGALRHFLGHEREREGALKRGGGRAPLTLDPAAVRGLEHAGLEPASADSPERAFERTWAACVLERARDRLAEEQAQAGKDPQWRALESYLATRDERGHGAELAQALGISENAVRVALHRLRRRFGELVRDEVRETVGPGEVEDEVRALRRALE